MRLLYLDDAGSAANSNEEYFVLAGVSVFEAQTNWFTQELDRLAQSIDAANPSQVEQGYFILNRTLSVLRVKPALRCA